MKAIYTVAQINNYIKRMVSGDGLLSDIRVKGEVSDCKYHPSGHIYFTIKDSSGVLSAIMFSGDRGGLDFELKKGQSVVVSGRIDVYEKSGKYQLYAKKIELEGRGALYFEYEKLKKKLEEEGIFDSMYKRDIPKYAMKVGVCTAKTGAAVQDIINISFRRNPFVKLYLYPALVQGEGAVSDITKGVHALDKMGLDVLIVGRGGGSIEDLWAFNDEKVAMAVFNCKTPVISAVGHETDTTIIDYVADLRAPTPSAAAELAVFDYNDFLTKLKDYGETLRVNINNDLSICHEKIKSYKATVEKFSPKGCINTWRQYAADMQTKAFDVLSKKMEDMSRKVEIYEQELIGSLSNKLSDRCHRLEVYVEKLSGLSPLDRLSSGYAHIAGKDGKSIVSVEMVDVGDEVKITLADGYIDAEVKEVTEERDG